MARPKKTPPPPPEPPKDRKLKEGKTPEPPIVYLKKDFGAIPADPHASYPPFLHNPATFLTSKGFQQVHEGQRIYATFEQIHELLKEYRAL